MYTPAQANPTKRASEVQAGCGSVGESRGLLKELPRGAIARGVAGETRASGVRRL